MQVTKNITLFLPVSLKPLFMFFAGLWFWQNVHDTLLPLELGLRN